MLFAERNDIPNVSAMETGTSSTGNVLIESIEVIFALRLCSNDRIRYSGACVTASFVSVHIVRSRTTSRSGFIIYIYFIIHVEPRQKNYSLVSSLS